MKGNSTFSFKHAAVGSASVKILNMALTFSIAILLARVLGAEGYGKYTFAITISSMLAVICQSGLPTFVTREASRIKIDGRWHQLPTLTRQADKFILLTSAVVAIVIVFSVVIEASFTTDRAVTIMMAAIAIPVIAMGNVRGAKLRGLGSIVKGLTPEFLVRPSFFLILIVFCLIYQADNISPETAVGLYITAAFVSLSTAIYLNRISGYVINIPTSENEYKYPGWLKSVGFLSINAGMNQILTQSDILLIGYFLTDSEVGLYRVPQQLAFLGIFGLQIMAIVVGPRVLPSIKNDTGGNLQKLASHAALFSFVFSLVFFFLFLILGTQILVLLFSDEYATSQNVLVLLSFSAVVNSLFGPVGIILSMSGNEKRVSIALACAALLNVALNVIFIPQYGILGAAVSTLICITLSNLIMWFYAMKKLSINCFPVYAKSPSK